MTDDLHLKLTPRPIDLDASMCACTFWHRGCVRLVKWPPGCRRWFCHRAGFDKTYQPERRKHSVHLARRDCPRFCQWRRCGSLAGRSTLGHRRALCRWFGSGATYKLKLLPGCGSVVCAQGNSPTANSAQIAANTRKIAVEIENFCNLVLVRGTSTANAMPPQNNNMAQWTCCAPQGRILQPHGAIWRALSTGMVCLKR